MYKVHPVSNYLYEKKDTKYNTLKSKGQIVVKFLNWFCKNCFIFKEPEARLSHLNIDKIEFYINSLVSEGKSKSTILNNQLTLKEFMRFLIENEIIINKETIQSYYERLNNKHNSFFQLYKKTSSKQIELVHELNINYIISFIRLAITHTNPIALGVYLQFFGGLRRGDCVNLTTSSIKPKGAFGEFGLELDIKERNLRPDLKNFDGTDGVKKPRTQVVFANRLLPSIFEQHLKTYEDISGETALFVDKNALPMSGRTYQQQFNKLKKIFIKKLLHSNNIEVSSYGLYLNNRRWSTHIGRGTFSNWIAESTGNPLDVAIARGDSNIESSLIYLEQSNTFLNGVNDVLNKMYENAWKYN
ncbi:hypothetical protein BJG89_04835 [Staphylococcus nepalensis]|uniref:hypothetical protein n=1 Tax=Staphylococcus TaxID=1279 RepID=UPI000BC30688|nr:MULTISPECIES: hypothetical protein [Staphylococcus]ATH59649.1 hypothetical protein BJD96_04505 [Staphylococcus nepalensis]ATH64739.1 hypothetical protein BJG89_04835 [Staphylococcus nepalensis]NWN86682.1 hypothetical protein [Staphylococcus sp.]